jgi:putative glutamine amidotransferase
MGVDGVLRTGARATIRLGRLGTQPHPAHHPHDDDLDALTLALIEVCVIRGGPILGVCRVLQQMNAAFGGSLYPEIHRLPGRMRRAPRESGYLYEITKLTRWSGCQALEIADH